VCTVDLIAREGDGQVVAVLRGELDVAYAASVAASLAAIAAPRREIIVDLAGLEFMDSSGVAALARARARARDAGGDLLLAAPQPQVLRVLTVIRVIDAFAVYERVDDAACRARSSRPPAAPQAGPAAILAAT
jgi:anti-sigma B factor antagonist